MGILFLSKYYSYLSRPRSIFPVGALETPLSRNTYHFIQHITDIKHWVDKKNTRERAKCVANKCWFIIKCHTSLIYIWRSTIDSRPFIITSGYKRDKRSEMDIFSIFSLIRRSPLSLSLRSSSRNEFTSVLLECKYVRGQSSEKLFSWIYFSNEHCVETDSDWKTRLSRERRREFYFETLSVTNCIYIYKALFRVIMASNRG